MCPIVKKWQVVIKAPAGVRTTDDYLLHLFSIGFTKRKMQQSNTQDALCAAATGQPDMEGDDGNHDSRQANDSKEVVSKQHWKRHRQVFPVHLSSS